MRRRDPLRDLRDGLDRPDLVVAEHDRDEDRAIRERPLHVVGVDTAVAVDRQLDDLEAELLEVAERVADRVVLDRAGDDAVTARLAGPGGALEREVVGLGATRREHELARIRVQARRQTLVCLVERGACRPPVRMRRRRVPEMLRQVRQHRVDDLATERGRRRMIEVDRHRRRSYPRAARIACGAEYRRADDDLRGGASRTVRPGLRAGLRGRVHAGHRWRRRRGHVDRHGVPGRGAGMVLQRGGGWSTSGRTGSSSGGRTHRPSLSRRCVARRPGRCHWTTTGRAGRPSARGIRSSASSSGPTGCSGRCASTRRTRRRRRS